jgi:pimeloyl-ACP methyl ester carboxylesterase
MAPVAVVGHGFGAAVAARTLGISSKGVGAFVAVSLQAPAHLKQAAGFPENLEAVNVPVLDVYAAGDVAAVLAEAPERELWGRKNKERVFDRIVMEDTAAGFHDREADLARRISEWLVANSAATR